MRVGKGRLALAAAALALLSSAQVSQAARVRYHYRIVDQRGATILKPTSGGAPGERYTWLFRWEPYNCPPPRATCMVTFRHPCSGRSIVLPLHLPRDIPRMEYRTNRVIYNYGTDTVQVHFQADGTADVIYTNEVFRAP